jgi:hypothetical protein
MPTLLSGVVDDADILSNQRVVDMSPTIAELEPDEAPLTTMLQKVSKRAAYSQKVEWLSDELVPRLTTLSASATSAATSLSVPATTGASSGTYFRAGDVIRIASTGENCYVTGVSADTLYVTRGIGGTSVTAVSAASGVDVIKVGNAAAEGATLGTLIQTKKVANFNYAQIQRDPWGFTNTLVASKLYGGPEPANEAKKKLIEHKRQLENTLFWGVRDLNTSGSAPIGYCGGVFQYATTNLTASVGTLTESVFESFLRKAFRYGSQNKVFFCSPLVASALSSFPQGKLAPPAPGITEYGVSLSSYQSASGAKVQIMVKRDWYDFQNTSNQYGGIGVMLDMDDITMRPLRDTVLKPDRQANDEDSIKQEYLTEWSFEMGNEKKHAIISGITGY